MNTNILLSFVFLCAKHISAASSDFNEHQLEYVSDDEDFLEDVVVDHKPVNAYELGDDEPLIETDNITWDYDSFEDKSEDEDDE